MEDTGTTAVAEPTQTTSTPTSSADTPQVTTDRPSIKDALTVFHEAAKQQGRKPRGQPPASSTVTPSPQDTATTQPDGTTAPQQTIPPASQKGPIPFEVHDRALQNARTNTRTEVESQFRTQYAPILSWAQRAATDRVGFLRDVIAEAAADPELAPQIASLAGRTLNGARMPTPAELPQPDFQDGQGNAFYSAKAIGQLVEHLKSSLKQELLGEVQPSLQAVSAITAEREQERVAGQLKQTFASQLTEARSSWPYFKEHETEIKQALAQAPLTSGHPAEEALMLQRIYHQIVSPKISQLEQDKTLATLKRNANASGLNPAAMGAPSGVPKNVRAKDGGTFKNALAWAATQQQTSG